MAVTTADRPPLSTAAGDTKRSFPALLAQLSRQSVDKHYDAYGDVAWDSEEMALDLSDPRLALPPFDGLAQTAWYQGQSTEVQARVGAHRVAAMMKTGWHFENLLQQGLLKYAFRLPNGSPQFRYVHHEIAEESQHTMMFQEFVDRTGLPVTGMPRAMVKVFEWGMSTITRFGPAAFFMAVLAGEEPVDYLQKRILRSETIHPLTERIMRIHVVEEARHVSYARGLVKELVPGLDRVRKFALSLTVPVTFGLLTPLMVSPPKQLTRSGVPRSVLREARGSETNRALVRESAAKPKRLAEELGLMNAVSRRLWTRLGL
jgi:hypothetical protein